MVCAGRLGRPPRLRCVENVRRSSGEMCSERCGLFRAHLGDHGRVSNHKARQLDGRSRPGWETGRGRAVHTQTSGRRPCSGNQTPRRPFPMAAGCRATSAPRRPWPCRCAGSGVAGGGAWIRCRARHGGRSCGGCRPRRGLVLVWTGQSSLSLALHLLDELVVRPCVVSRLVTTGGVGCTRGCSMLIVRVGVDVDATPHVAGVMTLGPVGPCSVDVLWWGPCGARPFGAFGLQIDRGWRNISRRTRLRNLELSFLLKQLQQSLPLVFNSHNGRRSPSLYTSRPL